MHPLGAIVPQVRQPTFPFLPRIPTPTRKNTITSFLSLLFSPFRLTRNTLLVPLADEDRKWELARMKAEKRELAPLVDEDWRH